MIDVVLDVEVANRNVAMVDIVSVGVPLIVRAQILRDFFFARTAVMEEASCECQRVHSGTEFFHLERYYCEHIVDVRDRDRR
jgi:hypothetical protein